MAIFKKRKRTDSPALSTFGGVFTPSFLTIVGIILFLRTGFIVGQVGLIDTLIIIAAANLISILTSFSLTVVATQMQVKGGGFYYVISRTLGVEFGGALGLILFISVSVSIAFYAIGLGEVVVQTIPMPDWAGPRVVAVGVILFLFIFAILGAEGSTRLQYMVMVGVVLALASFFWGAAQEFETAQFERNFHIDEAGGGFWMAFALFFPAITGFTQGLNMSGDLKNPARAIPLGTFLAVGISIVLYLMVAILLAGTNEQAVLRDDYFVMERVAVVPWLVAVGVISATASSGMASFLGAPRVMQALSRDKIFPWLNLFGKGARRDNNPRRAVILSGGIALTAVAIGDLNFLAPVITMFFLASYVLLNYATFFVARADSPSFRPAYPQLTRLGGKWVSLAGALLCVAAMLAIDWVASLIAFSVMTAIHQYLKRTAGDRQRSDSKYAYNFHRIRQRLLETTGMEETPRDWRPQILALSKSRDTRRRLLTFATWIEGRSGLTALTTVTEGKPFDPVTRTRLAAQVQEEIREARAAAFPLVVEGPDFRTTFGIALQAYGVGPLKANTVLVNWTEHALWEDSEASQSAYGRNIDELVRAGYNIVILATKPEIFDALADRKDGGDVAVERTIDVWWGPARSSELMLILAYLMTRTEAWEGARIRVLAQGKSGRPERTEADLEGFMESVRVRADVEIVETIDADTVRACSSEASIVFFPIRIDEDQPCACFDLDLGELLDSIPNLVLAVAGAKIDLEADPDEEKAADEEDDGDGKGKGRQVDRSPHPEDD